MGFETVGSFTSELGEIMVVLNDEDFKVTVTHEGLPAMHLSAEGATQLAGLLKTAGRKAETYQQVSDGSLGGRGGA